MNYYFRKQSVLSMKFAFYLVVILPNQKPDPESGSKSGIQISDLVKSGIRKPVKMWIRYIPNFFLYKFVSSQRLISLISKSKTCITYITFVLLHVMKLFEFFSQVKNNFCIHVFWEWFLIFLHHFFSYTYFSTLIYIFKILFKHNFCVKPYVPRESWRDPSNRRLNERGIYIRHCQELNSQPFPFQVGADPTRPQWHSYLFLL